MCFVEILFGGTSPAALESLPQTPACNVMFLGTLLRISLLPRYIFLYFFVFRFFPRYIRFIGKFPQVHWPPPHPRGSMHFFFDYIWPQNFGDFRPMIERYGRLGITHLELVVISELLPVDWTRGAGSPEGHRLWVMSETLFRAVITFSQMFKI